MRPVRATAILGVAMVATTMTMSPVSGAIPGTRATPKTGDAFYEPPAPLPKKAPGAIIRTAPISAPAGAKAWKILYHSRAVDGRDIAVSGVIVVPTAAAPKGGRPVFSWAHGTTGVADPCAPSKLDFATAVLPYVEQLVDAGYVVVATDYEGLGTPGVHPYLVGESEGRNVLDAARAARRFARADANDQVVVAGHSQGGQSALFAGELARSYAPDLDVRGVVAAAPAADIEQFLALAGNFRGAAGFLAMGLEGFHAAYPEIDPAEVLTGDALAQRETVTTKCAGEVMSTFFDLGGAGMLARDPMTMPDLQARLHENSAGNRAAGAPLLVVQGSSDQLIATALTDAFTTRACARGGTVDYRLYDADHVDIVAAAQDDVVAWVKERVAGEPAPTTCS